MIVYFNSLIMNYHSEELEIVDMVFVEVNLDLINVNTLNQF